MYVKRFGTSFLKHKNIRDGVYTKSMNEESNLSSKLSNIERRYTYHPPKPGQSERYVLLRESGKDIAYLLAEYRNLLLLVTPSSYEQEVALAMLDECDRGIRSIVMWSNAAIACNDEVPSVESEEDHGGTNNLI